MWQSWLDRIGKRSLLFALGGLSLFCLLLYANTLDNDFVLDDNFYIVDNYLLRDIGNIWKFIDVPADALVEDLGSGFLRGRNVRWVTYAIDYVTGGGSPFTFHLSNLIWHCLVTAALFLLLRTFLKSTGAAFLFAALFAAHPIQTAAVSYISGRKDLLATFFVLAAFLSLERYRRTPKTGYFAAAFLFFALGLFSKESAVVFPLLLLWSDWCREERLDIRSLKNLCRRHWGQYTVFFGGACLFAVRSVGIAPFLQLFSATPASGGIAKAAVSMPVENLSYANLMIFYVFKLLWPVELIADYRGAFTFSFYPSPWGTWLSPLFVLLCAGAAWLLHRWRPLVTLGLGWILLGLLPVSHLIPFHYPVAEHYLYLPSIGFILMVGAVLMPERYSLPRLLPCFLLLLVFATGTVLRNRNWQDMETITQDILQKLPNHQKARNTLVHLLAERGELQRALAEGEKAVRLDPDSAINHYNLAFINEELGRSDQAYIHYYRAIAMHPRLWDAYLNLGNLLLTHGRVSEGTAVLQRMMKLYGYHPLALWVLGNQQAREGNWAEAGNLYQRQLELDRSDATAHLGLAGVAWHLDQPEWRIELRRALDKGLRLDWVKKQQPWTTFLEEPEIRQFISTGKR